MDIVYTIWLRSMKRYVRSKSRIVGSIAMPLFLLVFPRLWPQLGGQRHFARDSST